MLSSYKAVQQSKKHSKCKYILYYVIPQVMIRSRGVQNMMQLSSTVWHQRHRLTLKIPRNNNPDDYDAKNNNSTEKSDNYSG